MAKNRVRQDTCCPRCGGDWDETGERCEECGTPARKAKKKPPSQRLSKDAYLTRYDSVPSAQRVRAAVSQLGPAVAFLTFFTGFLLWNVITGNYNGVQMTPSNRGLTLLSSLGSLSITSFLTCVGCRIVHGPSAFLERAINSLKWVAGAFLLILMVWFVSSVFLFRHR